MRPRSVLLKPKWSRIKPQLRRRKPTLPTILLTGHVGDIATAPIDRAVGGRVIVLQKPVRTGELVDRLAAAIDEAAG